MMRKARPSRTARKVALNIVTLGSEHGMDAILPPGIVDATATLLVESGAVIQRSFATHLAAAEEWGGNLSRRVCRPDLGRKPHAAKVRSVAPIERHFQLRFRAPVMITDARWAATLRH